MQAITRTIPQVLFDTARDMPNQAAVCEAGWELTYAELRDYVLKAASAMRATGLKKSDKFAIWAPNCTEWIITALAGQTLGAVLVPLNTRYKGHEAVDILRRSHSKMLFTVDGFLGHDYLGMIAGHDLPELQHVVILRDADSPTGRFEDFLACANDEAAESDAQQVRPDDFSDIIYTSGTTGAPKGAVTSHGQNVAVFETFTQSIGMKAGDRYLIVNPFFHSFGYKAGWLSCLIVGATIYPLAVYEPKSVLTQIERDKITVMPGAPTIFQTLLSHPERANFDISSLRVATTGATTIPVDLIRRMVEDLGIDHVYSAYGLTESCGVVSLCQKGDDFTTIATTCGRPLKHTQLRVVDDSGDDVDVGQPGEIWVKGFNVMQGYLDDDAATKEAITADEWLMTGDIGIQDEKGYIKITDRKKDMIIVGGFNCYPAEVEKILLTHPAISDVAVAGVADTRLGEVARAWVVTEPDSSLSEAALTTWARERMANFKVPRQITFLDNLPRNASGKVQKFLLTGNT